MSGNVLKNNKLAYLVAVSIVSSAFVGTLQADVTWSGDIDSADPTAWTSSTYAYIGKTVAGTSDAPSATLSITGGSGVQNNYAFIGYGSGTAGLVTVDGTSSTWTSNGVFVGGYGSGEMNITGGGAVSGSYGYIGCYNSTGVVTVDGANSTWTNSSNMYVGGYNSTGTLNITGGGSVSNSHSYIGYSASSTGVVTVDGAGSTWMSTGGSFYIGRYGSGTLNITGGGLVSVAGVLSIGESGGGDDFVNMSTGGMLAVYGNADDSITQFLDQVTGTDVIRYWDMEAATPGWADIASATNGVDYTLDYQSTGDLAGYTVLTVSTIPEPATVGILAIGGIATLLRRRQGRG